MLAAILYAMYAVTRSRLFGLPILDYDACLLVNLGFTHFHLYYRWLGGP